MPVSPDLRVPNDRVLLNRAEFEQAVFRELYRFAHCGALPEQIHAIA